MRVESSPPAWDGEAWSDGAPGTRFERRYSAALFLTGACALLGCLGTSSLWHELLRHRIVPSAPAPPAWQSLTLAMGFGLATVFCWSALAMAMWRASEVRTLGVCATGAGLLLLTALADLAFHGGVAGGGVMSLCCMAGCGFWPPASTLLAAGWALREKMRGHYQHTPG